MLEHLRDGDTGDIDPTVLDEFPRHRMVTPKTPELTGMGQRYAGEEQKLLNH